MLLSYMQSVVSERDMKLFLQTFADVDDVESVKFIVECCYTYGYVDGLLWLKTNKTHDDSIDHLTIVNNLAKHGHLYKILNLHINEPDLYPFNLNLVEKCGAANRYKDRSYEWRMFFDRQEYYSIPPCLFYDALAANEHGIARWILQSRKIWLESINCVLDHVVGVMGDLELLAWVEREYETKAKCSVNAVCLAIRSRKFEFVRRLIETGKLEISPDHRCAKCCASSNTQHGLLISGEPPLAIAVAAGDINICTWLHANNLSHPFTHLDFEAMRMIKCIFETSADNELQQWVRETLRSDERLKPTAAFVFEMCTRWDMLDLFIDIFQVHIRTLNLNFEELVCTSLVQHKHTIPVQYIIDKLMPENFDDSKLRDAMLSAVIQNKKWDFYQEVNSYVPLAFINKFADANDLDALRFIHMTCKLQTPLIERILEDKFAKKLFTSDEFYHNEFYSLERFHLY